MPRPEEAVLTEGQYRDLLIENKEHGVTVFSDLYVAKTHGSQIFTTPEENLPTAVRRFHVRTRLATFSVGRTERIIGLDPSLHDEKIWYEKHFDSEDRLRAIYRVVGRENTGKMASMTPIGEVGSHYHVSSVYHGVRDFGLGRTVMGLGSDIQGFEGLFDYLNRELLTYTGQIEDTFVDPNRFGPRPQADLAVPMLRAYSMGVFQGASALGETEVIQRAERFLDRFP